MSSYEEMVKTAEDAIATIKIEKLKEIAFTQILSHLLSGGKSLPLAIRPAQAGKKSKVATADSKKKSGTTTWLKELAGDKFFETLRNSKSILAELDGQSHQLKASDLTGPLQNLCHVKVLRRKKISPAEGKAPVWHWSNY